MSLGVKIISAGSYLPEKILDTSMIASMLGLDSDWIVQRTGVQSRHVASDDQATSDLAVIAARNALDNASLAIDDVDLILLSTNISDTTLPPSACRVHRALGASDIPTFDISASCSGFIYGCATAVSFIRAGFAKRVLFVCSEIRSKFIDYTDPDTSSVYGDGAGAVILEACDEGSGFIDIKLGADGRGSETITIPAGGTRMPATRQTVDEKLHYIRFHDKMIIKNAVRGIKKLVDERLKALSLSVDDIDLVIPHQMNMRMIESLSKRMHIPQSKFFVNIDTCGNTSSASIPIAIDQALRVGKIQKGQRVLFAAYGAGFTWGSAIYLV